MSSPPRKKLNKGPGADLVPILNGTDIGDWRPLEKSSIRKLQAEYDDPCDFEELFVDDKPQRYIRCASERCINASKRKVNSPLI